MLLITVLSVMNGFHKEVRERILGMASHATVSAFRGGLDEWQEAMRLAEQDERVIGSAPYVEGQAMTMRKNQVTGFLFRGIDPALEPNVSDVSEHLLSGSYEDLTPGSYNILLGKELAMFLGVGPGEKITVITPQINMTPTGAVPRLKRFTVIGLFEVGMGEYDRGVGLMNIRDAAKLMRLGDGVTGVRLKLTDLYLAPQVSRELANELPGIYFVSDWTRKNRNFFSALQTEKNMMFILLFLITVVAAFNIVSTLVMVVTDKQADIAILRTMGASTRTIGRIFIVQGTVLGLIGIIIGVILGVSLSLGLESIVAWIEQVLDVEFLPGSVYYISRLPSDLHLLDVVKVASGAFVFAVGATLYPAFKAARTMPAEALRYE